MPLDQTTIAFGLLILSLVIVLAWLYRLERRLHRFTLGRQGASLEEIINQLGKQVTETDRVNEEIKKHLINMEERLKHSVQHVKTVRFNPFRDQGQGGNQSFVTALLDEHGNGTVISTLYARDKVGVYGKPINNYRSTYELTEEEQEAIKKQVGP